MFATPTEAAAEAEEDSVFRLEEAAPTGWHHWNPNVSLGAGTPATFAADSDEPAGMKVLLEATDVEAIAAGDPIFYRGLQVGTVATSRLASDGTEVLVEALIAPEYASVIRSNTQFWNASGFEFDIGWSGLDAETGPLETLLRGGIQVATPEPAGEPAKSGDRFVLRAESEEGWQDWRPVLR